MCNKCSLGKELTFFQVCMTPKIAAYIGNSLDVLPKTAAKVGISLSTTPKNAI